jgi:hypothetical protein
VDFDYFLFLKTLEYMLQTLEKCEGNNPSGVNPCGIREISSQEGLNISVRDSASLVPDQNIQPLL